MTSRWAAFSTFRSSLKRAAANGQGIAMGRAALVFDDLMSGRLVDVARLCVPSGASYMFVTLPKVTGSVAAVEGWVRNEALLFRKA